MTDNDNKDPTQGSNTSTVTDEDLMAFADGELDNPIIEKVIHQSEDLRKRAELFASTGKRLRLVRTNVLEESVPDEMVHFVREALVARERKTPVQSFTDLVHAKTRKEAESRDLPDAKETRQTMRRPGLKSFTHMLRVSQTARSESNAASAPGDSSPWKREPRKYARPSLKAISDMMQVIQRAEVGFANVAACLFIAICIHLVLPGAKDPWQARYDELGRTAQLDTSSWSSNADMGFEEFTLLRFRSSNPNAGLESIVGRMLKNSVQKGLVSDTDGTKAWVILRAGVVETDFNSPNTDVEADTSNAAATKCVVGELIVDDGKDPEEAEESRFFRYCPNASSSRFTFLDRKSPLDAV